MRVPVLRSPLLASSASRRLGLMAGLAVVLAACSSSPAATTSNTPSATATATQSAAASGSTASSGETVKIVNFAYRPLTLTIKVGTKVTFINFDTDEHTATHGVNAKPDAHALFDIDLPGKASGSYTFTKAGTFPVTCKIHSYMNMTIVVQ